MLLNVLNGLIEALKESFQIFLENDERMPFKAILGVFFTFHDVEEEIPMTIFLHIEEIGPFSGHRP